jgi:hypothetical protein
VTAQTKGRVHDDRTVVCEGGTEQLEDALEEDRDVARPSG